MTRVIALAGGVGGAKLARGLAQVLTPDELLVVVNTGDDFEHLGLNIAPDLDTVMYTTAGIENRDTGWGLAGESWAFLDALGRLGGDTWFKLGDRDLATHIERTRRRAAGESLSAITTHLCGSLGIVARVTPMTDERVRTIVHTDVGALAFQDYFVRRRCEPRVTQITFEGAATAAPAPAFAQALADPRLEAIIVCPSNPFLSVAPIFALPAVYPAHVAWIGVSPIIAGEAVKGPAAKLFRELGIIPSAHAVVAHYGERVGAWLIDARDAALAPSIHAAGKRVAVADTMMTDLASSTAVARAVMALLGEASPLSSPSSSA